MASATSSLPSSLPPATLTVPSSANHSSVSCFSVQSPPLSVGLVGSGSRNLKRSTTIVSAFGDVSADGNTYLIAGAIGVALIGTAFPILFSRKDLCPECDGAGFIRKSGATLRANAARKDQAQIVCPNCNGLGKIGQIDK